MGRREFLLSLACLLLGSGCAPRKYQRAEIVNLHLHNNAGEVPIVDLYLSLRADHVVYIGDCGDVKHFSIPKEWQTGNGVDVSFNKARFYVRDHGRKDFICDILGRTTKATRPKLPGHVETTHCSPGFPFGFTSECTGNSLPVMCWAGTHSGDFAS
jgi:hypothetical protein